MDLVDWYNYDFRPEADRVADGESVSDEPTTNPPFSEQLKEREARKRLFFGDEEQARIREKVLRLARTTRAPLSSLYDAYQTLHQPRPNHFSGTEIRQLMHCFSQVEWKDEKGMLRYLSLVDDLSDAGIPLTTTQWNTAISFAGRWVRRVTALQVETAMQIWIRMEKEAGVAANHVTFNILFDVAIKAGKYALADVVIKEMRDRGMLFNRHFRTSMIYYYGMRGDGDGVRKAYRELVDAGEFVDTAVLNIVIVSLIRAGEASAAEHIFERMKGLDDEYSQTRRPPRDWRMRRQLGNLLDKAARQKSMTPERRTKIQEATPVAPDAQTYRSLITYHSEESGNIDRITELLGDMQDYGLQLEGSIFYHLFMGFTRHGGIRYSSWNKNRLDRLWAQFLALVERDTYPNVDDFEDEEGNVMIRSKDEVDVQDRGCYIDRGIVTAVLQAYSKCAGPDATMLVWEEIRARWKPGKDDLDAISWVLVQLDLLEDSRPSYH